jgi:ribonuclease R
MLVANDAVGLRLAQSQSEGIWRIHDHPDPEAIDALFRQFSLLGIPTPAMPEQISGREAAALAASAAAAAQRFANQRGRGTHTFAPRVLRSLKQAMYRDRSGVHSGLATEHYAHFTSPIRRYPDLINHRSLLRLIGASDDPPSSDDLADVANHVNEVERELQRLERRADRIAIAHLLHRTLHAGEAMGDTGDGVWAGEVTGLIGAGLFVRFGDVYEGFVPARTLSPAERYELDEHGLAMEGTRSGHRIRLGDAIRVYVDRVDRAAGKIDLRPVAPR